MGYTQGFQTIEQVIEYLQKCRPRTLPNGDHSFEPHSERDRTSEVRTFFKDNPQYQVSINGSARFIPLSARALERLNGTLPDGLRLEIKNTVDIAKTKWR